MLRFCRTGVPGRSEFLGKRYCKFVFIHLIDWRDVSVQVAFRILHSAVGICEIWRKFACFSLHSQKAKPCLYYIMDQIKYPRCTKGNFYLLSKLFSPFVPLRRILIFLIYNSLGLFFLYLKKSYLALIRHSISYLLLDVISFFHHRECSNNLHDVAEEMVIDNTDATVRKENFSNPEHNKKISEPHLNGNSAQDILKTKIDCDESKQLKFHNSACGAIISQDFSLCPQYMDSHEVVHCRKDDEDKFFSRQTKWKITKVLKLVGQMKAPLAQMALIFR